MKSKIFSCIIGVGVIALVCLGSNAQGQKRVKKTRPANPPATTTNSNASDYFNGNNTTPNTAAPTSGDTSKPKKTNVPIEVVPSTGNVLTDNVAPSMRSEDVIDRNLIKERTPLPYQYIREDDAVYMQRVWRVIDTKEKINLPFRNPSVNDGNSEMFLSILYKAIADTLGDPANRVLAFKDDRFSEPISPAEFRNKFSGGFDTSDVLDLQGNRVKVQVRAKSFPVDSVTQFEIKEEWVFDKQTSRLYARILGIAPMMKTYRGDGTAVSTQAYPLFWIYYPDLRPTLAKREVYSFKNYGSRMTWEDLFESRMFSSFIIKSTLDNPFDETLATKYPNNTLFRLLEGEKIKDKIFDYEQSLWSY